MQTEENELTPQAHRWIDGIHAHYSAAALPDQIDHVPAGAMAFKTA
jgi:hypothetical protein